VSDALRALGTLVAAVILVLLLPRWIPGDPARVAAGEWATAQDVAAIRHELALDIPWSRALAQKGQALMRGDLGVSLRHRRPVGAMLSEALPRTAALAACAMVLSAIFAWLLALPRSGRMEGLVALAIASPIFVAGPLLLWGIAQHLPGLPVFGWAGGRGLVMPSLALAVPLAGHQAKVLRAELAFFRDAVGTRLWVGQGVPSLLVWRRWWLPGLAGPWLTVLGLQMGALLGGAVVAESLFGLPGLGQLLVGAISSRDLPLVQGCVLLATALMVATLLGVELVQKRMDRRLR
jgi:ABC-type dipeptide/oligopeptide/nickel transport system permease component